MPYRARAGAWFNLSGIVAAYQPIAAPGPLLARANMANGGQDRYTAVEGVAPTWDPAYGWDFTNAPYLNTNYFSAMRPSTVVIRARFDALSAETLFGPLGGTTNFQFRTGSTPQVLRNAASVFATSTYTTITFATWYVLAFTLTGDSTTTYTFYVDGVAAGTGTSASTFGATRVTIGQSNGSEFLDGQVSAAAIYARALSPVEMWHVTRQMTYAAVNPDWNAWARQRRYYYAPPIVPPVDGAAAVTATATVSAAAGVQRPGAASVNASATTDGAGSMTRGAFASISAAATTSGAPSVIRGAAAAISGIATAIGAAIRTLAGLAGITGTATATGAGTVVGPVVQPGHVTMTATLNATVTMTTTGAGT